jgi:hypothetical protein
MPEFKGLAKSSRKISTTAFRPTTFSGRFARQESSFVASGQVIYDTQEFLSVKETSKRIGQDDLIFNFGGKPWL